MGMGMGMFSAALNDLQCRPQLDTQGSKCSGRIKTRSTGLGSGQKFAARYTPIIPVPQQYLWYRRYRRYLRHPYFIILGFPNISFTRPMWAGVG